MTEIFARKRQDFVKKAESTINNAKKNIRKLLLTAKIIVTREKTR